MKAEIGIDDNLWLYPESDKEMKQLFSFLKSKGARIKMSPDRYDPMVAQVKNINLAVCENSESNK